MDTTAEAQRLEAALDAVGKEMGSREVHNRLRRGGENEWSAMEIVGHLTEMIPYWMGQMDVLIRAETPPTFGRALDAPERLAGPAQGKGANVDGMLARLMEEGNAAARKIQALMPEALEQRGTHVRRGEMTVGDVFHVFIVEHAEEHLAQIRTTLGK